MSLRNVQELRSTREKLRLLEESYQAACQDSRGSRQAQELELRSLRHLINQLKEEIARFESRQGVTSATTDMPSVR